MKLPVLVSDLVLRFAGAIEPRDKPFDIRISQMIRPLLQMGDDTPDIRLRPGIAGRKTVP